VDDAAKLAQRAVWPVVLPLVPPSLLPRMEEETEVVVFGLTGMHFSLVKEHK
jgi:hypothetical protein